MIKKFSSPKMRNREFVFTPKIEYQLVAERSEANPTCLQFPTWCPQGESNPHPLLRREVLYPLSYRGLYSETDKPFAYALPSRGRSSFGGSY